MNVKINMDMNITINKNRNSTITINDIDRIMFDKNFLFIILIIVLIILVCLVTICAAFRSKKKTQKVRFVCPETGKVPEKDGGEFKDRRTEVMTYV